MKKNDVPHDHDAFKGKSDLHKLLYVTNDDGSYTSVNSEGWEVENMATRQAWEAAIEELNETEQKVKAGQLSPVAWYMQKNLMEPAVLARYMGKWTWQIRRHLKPEVFRGLSDKTIHKYAEIFNITAAELKNFGK